MALPRLGLARGAGSGVFPVAALSRYRGRMSKRRGRPVRLATLVWAVGLAIVGCKVVDDVLGDDEESSPDEAAEAALPSRPVTIPQRNDGAGGSAMVNGGSAGAGGAAGAAGAGGLGVGGGEPLAPPVVVNGV